MNAITGDKKLDAALTHMAGPAADRAIKAGIRASLSPLVKAMKAAVNSSGASTRMKRAARVTINSRFGKVRGGAKGEVQAKAGFGVGKQTIARKAKAAARAKAGKGVGISSTNIHWPVLGTQDRKTKSGKPTGAMPTVFGGLAAKAFRSAKSAMMSQYKQKIAATIAKEAAKARR